MQKCADPVLCYVTDSGKKLYRHFTLSDDIFKKLHQKRFDCGKCLSCRKRKSYELAARCVLHASLYKENCFLTLTYDENKEGYHNDIEYSDIQKFKKRLRQYCKRTFNKKIEVFNVHEYGKNNKKHWHLIVFNHNFADKEIHSKRGDINYYKSDRLSQLWRHGFHTIGDVSIASAMYQSQYMEKDIRNHNSASKRKSKSNHSGIGRKYFLLHYHQILSLGYVPFNGRRLRVPRYFEKLAKKHYCHFYDKGEFFDSSITGKKRQFRPFKPGEENLNIANLYKSYIDRKKLIISDLEKEWSEVVSNYLTTKETPDFIISNSNLLYDLKNKQTKEKF